MAIFRLLINCFYVIQNSRHAPPAVVQPIAPLVASSVFAEVWFERMILTFSILSWLCRIIRWLSQISSTALPSLFSRTRWVNILE